VFNWFDRRAGIDSLLHEAFDEPIPGGARLAYVFGSGLLFLFLSQIITGVFLALYYVPSADHAHTTIAYITKEVMAGSFLRSLHSYGSSAMVVVLILHLMQTFLYGSYKGRRELLWVSGCVLFALVIAMAFTGYLLPWDMKAYFATTVGTNIAGEMPLVGESIKRLMRGGNDMGSLTLSRFFVAHVFLIPAAIFGLVAMHVYLFRKAGAAGPISEHPIDPKQKTEKFYPRQLLMDLGFGLALIAALGLLSYLAPVELGPKADPADTQYLPRPEWYYLPVFQWLKYWQGSRAVIGIIVIPLIVIAMFVGLPFVDRRLERRPWKRPVAVATFAIVFFSLVGLGALSYRDDHRDPGIAAQLAKQHEDTEQFMRASFEPEPSEASLAAANVALADPLAAQGKAIFEAQSCNACHGDGGAGTAAGAKLTGIGAKFPADKLTGLLKQPTDKMTAGGMTAVEISDQEMKALVAYLNSLK
jgi:ubiquinol-cytochrome c reductase cytochrome b subunit